MPTVTQVWQCGVDLPDLKVYLLVVFKTNSCSTHIHRLLCVQHMSHETAVWASIQLSTHIWEKRFPPGSEGTAHDHLIAMVLRQGHDQCDHNLLSCNASSALTDVPTFLLEQPVRLLCCNLSDFLSSLVTLNTDIPLQWVTCILQLWHLPAPPSVSWKCRASYSLKQQKRVNVGFALLSVLIKLYRRRRCAALIMCFFLHHSLV